jgi:hypothetical protein
MRGRTGFRAVLNSGMQRLPPNATQANEQAHRPRPVLVPTGPPENSPAFQCREIADCGPRPAGTAESGTRTELPPRNPLAAGSAVPAGLGAIANQIPALKCRAIVRMSRWDKDGARSRPQKIQQNCQHIAITRTTAISTRGSGIRQPPNVSETNGEQPWHGLVVEGCLTLSLI